MTVPPRVSPSSPGAAPGAGVLSLVEAAYSVDLPHVAWALGVLRALEQAAACDLGGFICFWDWPEGGHPDIQVHSAVADGVGEHNAPRIFTALAGAPRAWLGGIIESASSLGLCALTSEVDPGGQLSYRNELRDEGVHEGLARAMEQANEARVVYAVNTFDIVSRPFRALPPFAWWPGAVMGSFRRGAVDVDRRHLGADPEALGDPQTRSPRAGACSCGSDGSRGRWRSGLSGALGRGSPLQGSVSPLPRMVPPPLSQPHGWGPPFSCAIHRACRTRMLVVRPIWTTHSAAATAR
jgi:hypothetical protein